MSSEDGIYNYYFNLYTEYKEKYGNKTIVLLQVGAFFEVYGIKDIKNDLIHNNNIVVVDSNKSNIIDFTNICQLTIAEKKAYIDGYQIVMAGFRDFSLDKYISILTDNGYTVPVYVQIGSGKNIKRELDTIYSPGTYFSCDVDKNQKISNNIMCVWIQRSKPIKKSINGLINKDLLIYGLSVINIYTGESYFFQYETIFNMIPSTFDELQRYVSIYLPCEIIIVSDLNKEQINLVVQYSDIQSNSIHFIDSGDKDLLDVRNSSNQKYIKEMITKYFGEESYDICCDFRNYIIASQSYVYLLNFIEKHSINLLKKIALPVFYNTSDRVVLANHTLCQLNIIDNVYNESRTYGKLSSVLTFLNNCCSPMGRRKIQYQITNPTFNEEWLQREYNIIEYTLRENIMDIEKIRKELKQIRDIDKITRQIIMKKIYPSTIYALYSSIMILHNLNTSIEIDKEITNYLKDDVNEKLGTDYIITYLNNFFVINKCKGITSMNNFDENIINEGVCLELDEIVIEYENSKLYFEQIKNYLNEIMRKYEKNQKTDYIRIHETEKSGVSLQITNKRSILLIEYLKQEYVNMCNLSNEKIEYKEKMKLSDDALLTINDNIKIAINDVKFIKSSSTNVDIHIPILNDTIKNIIKLKSKINDLITTTYIDILDKMNPILIDKLDSISKYTANIDVLQNKVYVAKKYNYCKPIIDTNAEKSYVDVKDIRHCLIEHLQQNELYVTNDVKLGKKDDYNGILLYGTNAVGKTSLIRAIGVSIIMAQSGFYVPSTNFIYKPYTAIFSRILSNDNLFKGLSTFAVEMSELRVILKMSDENSLILGDELCSGTETQSAISIFLAGLNTMHVKESSFIFATHFHEIVDYEEINKLNKMILLHMEVRYNKEKNILEYDRKLKKGSGPKSYGLEVCKSLYLEDDFIDLAYSYRNKYFPDNKSTLMYDTTHYNKKKIKGKCEICKETISSEIHHLQHQEDADDNGFINTFHKNHKANLISICENCHKEIHKKDSTLNIKKRKKTTKGYVLTND